MTTTIPYPLATTEDDSGAFHPAEALWTPTPEDAVRNGFISHHGVLITGVGKEDEPPTEFVALGHAHTWRALWDAATAYMQGAWGVADLYSDPVTRERIGPPVRPQMPTRSHALFLRHPHPERPCGCERDGMWRLVDVAASEPGAVAVTIMRNPAVTV